MLLAIDVGNTETKLGCFQADSNRLIHTWRVTTEQRRTGDEYGIFLSQLFASDGLAPGQVTNVVIASVVPKLEQALREACTRLFSRSPVFLQAHHQSLIAVATERPGEVGADLIAAAIGARASYGAPLIVVSYGTATVFMAISAQGAYLGTAIAPGIATSIDALIGRTAKLPQISLQDPGPAIGRDTIASLQSGIVYGFVGQTQALIERMRSELGYPAKVVATGGLADVVARHAGCIDTVDPQVSLQGLRLYYLSLA